MQLGGGIQNTVDTRAVEAGKLIESSACSLTNVREVHCWGGNEDGQASGDGAETAAFENPVLVINKSVTAIAVGVAHACAIASQEVHCWGDNLLSQIARETDTTNHPVSRVQTVGMIKLIAAGHNHTCIADADGEVYCWGDNRRKQSGPNSPLTLIPAATALGNTTKAAIALTMGETHSCLLGDDERVYCWGDNTYGQLGIPSNSEPNTPVVNLFSVVAISAGQNHTCALVEGDDLSQNGVYCWGQNDRKQLFSSGDDSTSIPVLAYPRN
ncbi:MAG: hypothetical protein JKY56_11610 [Kofleriaceae bacterium]|nr:hypothetical protein [Kofleriaceae bacterium]